MWLQSDGAISNRRAINHSNCVTNEPTASPVLTKRWYWELILATNFGSLCQTVTKVGSRNVGYQIWFCTRVILFTTKTKGKYRLLGTLSEIYISEMMWIICARLFICNRNGTRPKVLFIPAGVFLAYPSGYCWQAVIRVIVGGVRVRK